MLKTRFVLPALFACLMVALPATAVSNGACGSCSYPFDAEFEFFAGGPATATQARQMCASLMSLRLPHPMATSGFVVRWDDPKPASGQPGIYRCFACVGSIDDDSVPDQHVGGTALDLETAASIARGCYDGEIGTARRLYTSDLVTEPNVDDNLEVWPTHAGYLFTMTGPAFEDRQGLVKVDPAIGQCGVLFPIGTEEH